MAEVKTLAELVAQINAGIKSNPGGEITPPIHSSIERNIAASSLNKKDGGVMQNIISYESDYALTGDLQLTHKKWVNDQDTATLTAANAYTDAEIAAIPTPDLTALWNLSGNVLTERGEFGSTGDPFGWDYKVGDDKIGDVSNEGILNFIKGYKRNSVTLDDRKAIILKGTTLATFGDSISSSFGVSSGYGWQDIFASILGVTISNQAVSGRGVYKSVENAYALIGINSSINSCWMAGFNDLRRSASASTYNKLKGSLRAFLANQFLKTAVAGNDGTVTRTGTWTNLATGVIGDKAVTLGGAAVYSSSVGNTIEYTFTGNSLVIGTWAVDGVNEFGGTFTVDIDGTVVGAYTSTGQTDGVSDGTYNNQRTPNIK
jgi:hypothetical protein